MSSTRRMLLETMFQALNHALHHRLDVLERMVSTENRLLLEQQNMWDYMVVNHDSTDCA